MMLPFTLHLRPTASHYKIWQKPQAVAGLLKSVLKWPRVRLDWINMRYAVGWVGIATLPLLCLHLGSSQNYDGRFSKPKYHCSKKKCQTIRCTLFSKTEDWS